MNKNPYLGRPSTRAGLGTRLVPHLVDKKEGQIQGQKSFTPSNDKSTLPRKSSAGFIVFEVKRKSSLYRGLVARRKNYHREKRKTNINLFRGDQ